MSDEKVKEKSYAEQNPLSKALDGKFRLKNANAGVYIHKNKEYDLRKISLEQAEQLVKEGFPFLEPITGKSEKPTP